MKYLSILLVSFVFIIGCGKPKAEFQSLVHDFGKHKVKTKATHIFQFINTGKADLIIKKVKAACRCTGTLLSKKRIPAGETGEIKVTLKMNKRPGKMRRSLKVYTNDPKRPIIRLTVKAMVVE